MPARLGEGFFNRPAPVVARELLGQVLVHGARRGVIIETEAYLADGDPAAHSVQGKKAALRALALGPGTVYIHPMRQFVGMDIVCADGSVLLRGLDLPGADGPGKVCRVMGVTRVLYGVNVADGPLAVEAGLAVPDAAVVIGRRVGIRRAVERELRFMVRPRQSGDFPL